MFSQLLSGAKSSATKHQQPQQTTVSNATKQQPTSAWSFLTSKTTKEQNDNNNSTASSKKKTKKKQNSSSSQRQQDGRLVNELFVEQQQPQSRKISNSSHTPTVSSSSGYNSVAANGSFHHHQHQATNGSSSASSSCTTNTNGRHYATASDGPTMRLTPAHYALPRYDSNNNNNNVAPARSFHHRLAAAEMSSAVQLDPNGNQQQRPPRYLMQVAAPMVPMMIDDDDDDNSEQLDHLQHHHHLNHQLQHQQHHHNHRRHQAKLMIDGQLGVDEQQRRLSSSLGDENDDEADDDDETTDLMVTTNNSIGNGQHFYHHHHQQHDESDDLGDRTIVAQLQQQLKNRRQKSQLGLRQKSWLVGQEGFSYTTTRQQRPVQTNSGNSLDYLDEQQAAASEQLCSSLNHFQSNKGHPTAAAAAITSRQQQNYQSSTSFSYHQPNQLIYDTASNVVNSQFQANKLIGNSKSLSIINSNHNSCLHSSPVTAHRIVGLQQQPPATNQTIASYRMQSAAASANSKNWAASSSSPDLHHHHHHQRENSSKRKSGHTNSGLIVPTTPSKQQHYLDSSNIKLLQKQPQQQQQQQMPPPPPNSFQDPTTVVSNNNNNNLPSRSGARDSSTPLSCCGKLAKFLLFISNVLFWSAGLGLGAWGILALIEDHKYNLSQLLVFEANSRMSLFQLLSWSFITLGCASILVGFCGCSAIFKNNRWILGLFIFLILAIFALDLATGLLAIIFQERLVANIRLKLVNKLRNEYGVQASFTAAIDYIQTKYECCGLDGHSDYDQSLWRLQRLGGFEATVARTCCHLRNTFDDQAHVNPRPVNETMCQSTDVRFHQSYRYRRGCLDDLERFIRHKIWTFTIGCGAVGAVILVSLLFATCFCRSIPNTGSRKSSSSFHHHGDHRRNLRAPIVLSYVDKNNKSQQYSSHGTHYR